MAKLFVFSDEVGVKDSYGYTRNQVVVYIEAILYAIDSLNTENLIPGVTFGVSIVNGSQILFSNDTDKSKVFDNISMIVRESKNSNSSLFLGMIDGLKEHFLPNVLEFVKQHHLPLLGFPYSINEYSTRPSYNLYAQMYNTFQMKLNSTITVLEQFGWDYIQIVAPYSVKQFSKQFNICVANSYIFMNDYIQIEDECNRIVEKLMTTSAARVVVLMLSTREVKCILNTAKTKKENYFQWVTYVIKMQNTANEYQNITEKLIQIEKFDTMDTSDFEKFHLDKLTPENNKRNPYFAEVWQRLYSCDLTNETTYGKMCSSEIYKTNLSKLIGVNGEAALLINAFKVYGMALHNLWRNKCKPGEIFCNELRNIDGESFFKDFVLKVDFKTKHTPIAFYRNEATVEFEIKELQNVGDHRELKQIASWRMNRLDKYGNELNLVESTCAANCTKGSKQIRSSHKCNCLCAKCNPNEYLIDKYTCQKCDDGKIPNDDFNNCI
ncbi:metabotropic glutamate receptor-like protein [Leptotrombidium deliense]|uniref:Metabotropic glutamate receptor-like protein n=1 Tax=Leptotrombidium deliense TaxID=299467 RepID=A0A443S4L9_9ACAR|nr:metabotropic glutamate receptor-like protein [Leptotrombidium deliense]